jgi:deoxyribonucleoside regulator
MVSRTSTDNDELLAVRAAELYYEENKTHDEIGAILRITRWKVGRLLQAARENGIIRIDIVHPRARKLSLEHELIDAYGLQAAIVVPRDASQVLTERIASAGADYLVSMRPRTHRLGVSWGKTLHHLAQALPHDWSTPVSVVQTNGGVSRSAQPGLAAETAAMIAAKSGGSVTLMPTPAILEKPETRLLIESDRSVSGVLEQAQAADTFLFSAGPASDVSIHVHSGYLGASDIKRLQGLGAVGDVMGRYITASGDIADPELDERTLGLTLKDLRRADRRIAVIGGSDKHAVALALVSNHIANILITDEDTAEFLVNAGRREDTA